MSFPSSHYGHSITTEVSMNMESKNDVVFVGESPPGAINIASQKKADTTLRIIQNSFAPEDRAPAGYYRLVASAFPYASRLPHVSISGNNWHSAARPTMFEMPNSRAESFVDMSLNNMTAMVQDFMFYSQRVCVIIQQGVEFIKEDMDQLRMWQDPNQTDLSECYHSAYAVQHACSRFTAAKLDLETYQLRSKTAYISVMCGEGVKHHGDDEEGDMVREPGDHYGIAAQADALDMANRDFPKGAQAFANPRVANEIESLCRKTQQLYELVVLKVWEARDRMQHLLSIVEGPHGSIFQNMRDYSLIAQLTRWMKSTHVYFATFEPLHAVVVDAKLSKDWQDAVVKQWRELPDLMDEVNFGGRTIANGPRALRMPPIQLLLKLKLSYDFNNRTYLRSLMTHADTFLYRAHMGSRQESPVCYARSSEGLEICVKATEQLDPFAKQARFLRTPNGLFMSHVFNEDVIDLLMERLDLYEVMRLMFTSRVMYMLCSKQSKYWTYLSNMFLIKHRMQFALINGRKMMDNIKFRGCHLPRLDGAVFDRHYQPFYQIIATLTTLTMGGQTFCNCCLKESKFRSPLHASKTLCKGCYDKRTITATALTKQRSATTREWFRSIDVLRSILPWRLEMRPTRTDLLRCDIVFDRDSAELALMQLSNMSRVLSPSYSTLDISARLEDNVDIRYVLGGAHAQLREPRKVKLCANFHKYAQRQYGVNKVTLTDGHDREAVRRFMGDYSHPRNSKMVYDMRQDRITVSSSFEEGVGGEDLAHFPYYNQMPIDGQDKVYRVNKPFTVMTASQPPKVCQVVAMKKLHDDFPLCETCYGRCYSSGPNAMMEDTDDSDVEIVEG